MPMAVITIKHKTHVTNKKTVTIKGTFFFCNISLTIKALHTHNFSIFHSKRKSSPLLVHILPSTKSWALTTDDRIDSHKLGSTRCNRSDIRSTSFSVGGKVFLGCRTTISGRIGLLALLFEVVCPFVKPWFICPALGTVKISCKNVNHFHFLWLSIRYFWIFLYSKPLCCFGSAGLFIPFYLY